jgi:hypothetical protein
LEDCTPEFLAAEAKAAAKLWAEDFIREIYNRSDGMGGIIVVEAKDEDEVRGRMGSMPMVANGYLRLDVYGARAWRVIDDVAAG